jgi:hypothetical protein
LPPSWPRIARSGRRLVDGAFRTIVGDGHVARYVAVRVEARSDGKGQVGAGQRRVEEAGVDVAPVDPRLAQRNRRIRRQREVGVADRAPGLAGGVDQRGLEVAAGAQLELRRTRAGHRLRLGQAGSGIELERARRADAAAGRHLAPGRRGNGVLQLPFALVAAQLEAQVVDLGRGALVDEGGLAQARIADRDRERRRQRGRHRGRRRFTQGFDAQRGGIQLVDRNAAGRELPGRPVDIDLVGGNHLVRRAEHQVADVHVAVQGTGDAGDGQLAAAGVGDFLGQRLQRGFAAEIPVSGAENDAGHGQPDRDPPRPAPLARRRRGGLGSFLGIHQKVNPSEKCKRNFLTACP